MAFLDATLWNNLQESDATNEKRFSELGLIDAVKSSTPFTDYIPPSAKAALQSLSSLRDVEIPVIKDQEVTVVITPGFQFIPDNLAETDKYSFTSFDVFTGFRFYEAAFGNNMIDANFYRDQTMKNISYASANVVESILTTTLELRKTQVLNETFQVSQGDGTFTFQGGTDILEIDKAAQKETMFFNLQQLMAANELPGNYRIVNNRAGLSVQRAEAAKYGSNNEKNLQALGFLPADRMHETGNIAAEDDIFNGFLLRDGSIGMFENFPHDFANNRSFSSHRWTVSDMDLPFTKMRANIYTNTEATNATSLITAGEDSNLIMTAFEEMAIWFRFYIVYRYNSDLANRANDIVKIRGLAA